MPMEAGDAVWVIRGDITDLQGSLAQGKAAVEKTTAGVTQSLATVGRSMTVMGAAILAPLAIGVKTATEFGTAMAGVASLGVKNMGALEKAVRTVAVAYGQDLIGATKATYQMISAGVSEMDAPLILAEAAKAATAGQTDLTTAIELGTAMTSAFGGEMTNMSKVFDSAFVAVKLGVTTFEELSASAGKTAPAFAAAGLSLDEMYGSVAALTKGGFDTSVAFTSMNAVVSAFTRQGESARLKTLGLQGALKWLQDEVKGDQTAMLKFLGSTEAMSATLSLTGAVASDLTDIMSEMKSGAGAAKEAFDIIAESDPGFAWAQMKATLQDLAITVGQALLPALGQILTAVMPVVKSIAEWMKEHKALTQTLLVVVGAIGAFLITVGPLLMILPGIVALFSSIGTILGVVGAAFGVVAAILSGPVILAILAVVAVGALIWVFWDEIKAAFQAGTEFVFKVVRAWFDVFNATWIAAFNIIKMANEAFWAAVGAVWNTATGAIVDVITAFWEFNVRLWNTATGAVMGVVTAFWDFSVGLWNVASGIVIGIAKALWGVVTASFNAGVAVIKGILTGAINFIKGIWEGIVAVFQWGVDRASALVDMLAAPFLWLINVIKEALRLVGIGRKQGVPNIGARAEGGPVAEGLTMVGERGPEAIIRRGSEVRVLSAANTPTTTSGGGPQVTINMGNVTVRDSADIDRLSEELARATVRGLRTVGVMI